MPKIESIRPGGTLDASFTTYPMAELLIGILRGNLTGRLDIFLHPEPRNRLHFKNGVPVSVQLPDAGVSLAKILIDDGALPRAKGLDLLRLAEASGTNEEAVIRQHRLLSEGALEDARRRRARAQVVKMFDAGPVEFRFSEGAALPAGEPLTILQSLPLVFEGLSRGRDHALVDRFVAEHGTTGFALTQTFPRGVDPFEWGEGVEQIITGTAGPLSVAGLMASGLSQEVAAAALLALSMAGMVEARGPAPGVRPPAPAEAAARAPEPAAPSEAAKATESSGLVIHRRSGGVAAPAPVPPVPSPAPSQAQPEAVTGHEAERRAVEERLLPLSHQSYFQLLRVSPGTERSQLERSYRFLARRGATDAPPDDPGARAVDGLLREAFEVLCEPGQMERYAALVDRSGSGSERHAFEAEPKVDRAVRAMARGHTGEAAFLLSWAEKLDPTRTDIPVMHAMIDFLRAPAAQRARDARGLHAFLAQECARHPHDGRMKLCQAVVSAELQDARAARALLAAAPDREHPMAVLARRILGEAP